MKLYKYKLKAANTQYDSDSEIIVADVSERKAIERAEDVTDCDLNIVVWYGLCDTFNEPCIVKNTFKQ